MNVVVDLELKCQLVMEAEMFDDNDIDTRRYAVRPKGYKHMHIVGSK